MTSETVEIEAVHFPVSTAEEARDALGGHVSAEGVATQESGGDRLRVGEGLEFEVPDVSPWPEDVVGRKVLLRGRLMEGASGGFEIQGSRYEVLE